MNVASKELSEELFELSGWGDPDVYFRWTFDTQRDKWQVDTAALYGSIPAYDLGYLLRKLPKFVEHEGTRYWLTGEFCDFYEEPEWVYDYVRLPIEGEPIRDRYYCGHEAPDLTHADTPEDAAAKLAIELFKQGILQKGKS